MLTISVRAKGIGSEGMLGIGFGGSTMFTAEVTLFNFQLRTFLSLLNYGSGHSEV